MLILFFTIVFIAELIVAEKAISWIKQKNLVVCEINQQITEIKPLIDKGVISAKNGVCSLTNGMCAVSKFILSKKREGIKILTKIVFAGIMLIVLKKMPNKKILTVVDVLFTFANLLKL